MAKVLVFHYTEKGRLPKLGKKELNDVLKKLYDVLKDYPDVRFNGTYVDEKGMGICDWEAPSADVVKEIVKKVLGAEPADPVIVVKRVL
ncbi:MAG: nickel-binding protein [Candidatus Bathyarchaeota archaeon]